VTFSVEGFPSPNWDQVFPSSLAKGFLKMLVNAKQVNDVTTLNLTIKIKVQE